MQKRFLWPLSVALGYSALARSAPRRSFAASVGSPAFPLSDRPIF